jgi:hypothetical protein
LIYIGIWIFFTHWKIAGKERTIIGENRRLPAFNDITGYAIKIDKKKNEITVSVPYQDKTRGSPEPVSFQMS